MRQSALLTAVFAMLLLSCGGGGAPAYDAEPIETEMTLELEFGAYDLPEEYLLARPYNGLTVNGEGDIFVVDEDRIKVFDSNGRPKTILGGPGEGPGEFSDPRSLSTGPAGFLTALDYTGRALSFNLFAPDLSFIEKRRFSNMPAYALLKENEDNSSVRLGMNMISNDVFTLDRDRKVYYVQITKDRRKFEQNDYYGLVYETPDTVIVLAEYAETGTIMGKMSGIGSPEYGSLVWDILPGNRVVYTETWTDKAIEDGAGTYTLHLVDLDNMSRTTIDHPFTPFVMPDSVTEVSFEYDDPELTKRYEEDYRIISAKLKERKYYAPLMTVFTDRGKIFAARKSTRNMRELVLDVFDGESLRYIHSAYIDRYPKVVRNGFGYATVTNDEGFYVIQKYRIDPAVYGKD